MRPNGFATHLLGGLLGRRPRAHPNERAPATPVAGRLGAPYGRGLSFVGLVSGGGNSSPGFDRAAVVFGAGTRESLLNPWLNIALGLPANCCQL